jgi:hypothetical protein
MRQLHPARPLRQSPAHPHPVFIKKEEIHVVPTSLTLCKITHLQQLLYSPLLKKISFIFSLSFIPHRAQHLPQLLWPPDVGKVYSNQSLQRLLQWVAHTAKQLVEKRNKDWRMIEAEREPTCFGRSMMSSCSSMRSFIDALA